MKIVEESYGELLELAVEIGADIREKREMIEKSRGRALLQAKEILEDTLERFTGEPVITTLNPAETWKISNAIIEIFHEIVEEIYQKEKN